MYFKIYIVFTYKIVLYNKNTLKAKLGRFLQKSLSKAKY